MKTHNQQLDTLESLVDQIGLADTIDRLAEVCSAKADHLEDNWQDHNAAVLWGEMAGRLLTTSKAASDKGLTS